MNVSVIQVAAATEAEARPQGVATPAVRPRCRDSTFAALFLTRRSVWPGVPGRSTCGGRQARREAKEEAASPDAPKDGDDPNALAAAAAAGCANAAALLIPTAPTETPAQGAASAAVQNPSGAANAPVPAHAPTGQQPAAASGAANINGPQTPAAAATDAQVPIPDAPLAGAAAGDASATPVAKRRPRRHRPCGGAVEPGRGHESEGSRHGSGPSGPQGCAGGR
jgi:hypothetical protein